MAETREPMKLAVTGAAGRMGQSLIRTIASTEGVVLAGAIEREGSPDIGKDSGELSGTGRNGIAITADARPVFAGVEGVVDFTIPAATLEFASLAAEAGIVHVIGTTGMSAEDDEGLDRAAHRARIVKSGNMSLGVNLLAVLVREAARALEASGWDIEILEMHHRHKVDAPSGTALLLGEAAAEGRGISLDQNAVKVRDGHTGPRERGTIGFATLRGGSVVGEHSVLLAGDGETIELSHRAIDRQIFARGAVKAALWARDQRPGRYSMLDVLSLAGRS